MRELTREFLVPLVQYFKDRDAASASLVYHVSAFFTVEDKALRYYTSTPNFVKGLTLLNRYFAGVMLGTLPAGSDDEAAALGAALLCLRAYIGFALDSPNYSHSFGTREPFVIPQATTGVIVPLDEDCQQAVRELLRQLVRGQDATRGQQNAFLAARIRFWDTVVSRISSRHDTYIREFANSEYDRLDNFAQGIIALARELSAAPVKVPSGQYEPIYEDRPIADVRNEIANTLSNLPEYTARCRIDVEGQPREYTIRPRYHGEVASTSESQAVVERIVERTRKEYCTERALVEDQIRRRQELDDDPGTDGGGSGPTPSDGPRRRSPPRAL